MSVTSGFFNSLSGDRKYDAIQISSMFDGLITDGIYNGFLESFMVTASSPASMVVTVGEGRCWFNHTWTLNDAPLPLTLDVGDVVLNRIDTIVIDVDSTDTVRACTIKVIKGTPSSQAVRPTLENTETHHQYPLCDISVPAGATTITQSNITNRRGTSDCPFVATLMKSVDVDDLLIQWESQWNDWMTDRADAMDTWTAEQQEAFTTWFQTVQDILDENTAGNLLNRINHRTGINATATYSAGVVAITAPDDAGEILTFVAPSDFLSSDTYTLNGEALTITDLNGEALDDSWKKNSPVTITVSGGKAFFKAGGSGKNDTLPPLLGNMTVEVVEGDENDTYTIKMDKLVLDKTTEMVGGAQLEWGEEMPAKPGKGTGGIKTWTREEIITTGKPFSELTEGDIVKLKENGTLVDFYVAKHDYESGLNGAGRTLVVRKDTYDDRASAMVEDNGDGTYTLSSDFVSHTVEVPHGQKVVFRQFTQNQKKQFQTMLVGGVYPPLGEVEPPFALPEFTGNHAIFGDETAGRIELYESGELTLSPGVYDIFAVGGGSSGIFGGYKQGSKTWHRVGGGGSGYTKTVKGYVQEKLAVLNVIIGAGGAVRTQTDNQANLGSATKIVNALAEGIIEAPGGGKINNSAAEAEAGQPGGSGGGSSGGDYNRGGNGGSDGSNGEAYGNTPAGQGQNTTTRAFEESSNTIYAGGGSGFNNSYRAPGGGGAGGGIDGQQQTARDGTTNTGSGGGAGYKNSKYNVSCGAGGSGIIIIRWKNA